MAANMYAKHAQVGYGLIAIVKRQVHISVSLRRTQTTETLVRTQAVKRLSLMRNKSFKLIVHTFS